MARDGGPFSPSAHQAHTYATLPLGTQTATYIIRGQRGTLLGKPSEAVTVQFGVGSDGAAAPEVSGATLALAA